MRLVGSISSSRWWSRVETVLRLVPSCLNRRELDCETEREKTSVRSCAVPQTRSYLGKRFPRGAQVKLSVVLRQLNGLDHHTSLFLIVSNFGVARQGEIFAHGVTLETVVGQDATKIRMIGEIDSIHVPNLGMNRLQAAKRQIVSYLSFHPVGRIVEIADARHG